MRKIVLGMAAVVMLVVREREKKPIIVTWLPCYNFHWASSSYRSNPIGTTPPSMGFAWAATAFDNWQSKSTTATATTTTREHTHHICIVGLFYQKSFSTSTTLSPLHDAADNHDESGGGSYRELESNHEQSNFMEAKQMLYKLVHVLWPLTMSVWRSWSVGQWASLVRLLVCPFVRRPAGRLAGWPAAPATGDDSAKSATDTPEQERN